VAIQQFRAYDEVLRLRSDQYAKTAYITGIAPPKIAILDNKYVATYFDSGDMQVTSDAVDNKWPRVIEYFYRTPDMPEIVREQAHIIMNHINLNPQARNLFVRQRLASPDPNDSAQLSLVEKEYQRRLIKSLIYPKWDPNIFQAMKPTDPYDRTEWYHWFWNNPESKMYLDSWRSTIASESQLIGNRFKRRLHTGVTILEQFRSKYYVVGKLVDNNQI
jgi:hypothetical protein